MTPPPNTSARKLAQQLLETSRRQTDGVIKRSVRQPRVGTVVRTGTNFALAMEDTDFVLESIDVLRLPNYENMPGDLVALLPLEGAQWVMLGPLVKESSPLVLGPPVNRLPLATANLNMNTHKIINVVDPTGLQDAATKKYVDDTVTTGAAAITFANGTVGTPSIRFTNSPSTGIYRPAADQLAVVTAGAQRLLFGATGALAFPNDTSFLVRSQTSATVDFLVSRITTDTQDRFAITPGGTLKFGPGGAVATDTTLSRASAGVMQVGSQAVIVANDPRLTDTRAPTAGTVVDASVSATAEIAVSKLADGAAYDVLQTNADGVTVAWVSGLTNNHVSATAGIVGTKLADAPSGITTAKINDSQVTTAKIGDSQVTTLKIADLNVTTAKIGTAQVTGPKLSADLKGEWQVASQITFSGFNVTTNAGAWTPASVSGAIVNVPPIPSGLARVWQLHVVVGTDAAVTNFNFRDAFRPTTVAIAPFSPAGVGTYHLYVDISGDQYVATTADATWTNWEAWKFSGGNVVVYSMQLRYKYV